MLSPKAINHILLSLNRSQPNVKLGFELSPQTIAILRKYPAEEVYPLLFGYYKGLLDSLPHICDKDSYYLNENVHKNWSFRYISALFSLDVDQLYYLLALWIECDNPEIRAWGCFYLKGYPGPKSVEALSRVLLDDPSPDVRSAAAESLIEIGDPSALPALEQALLDTAIDSEGYSVAKAAKVAIERIREKYKEN